MNRACASKSQRGFSMLELMIVLLVMSIMMGAIFQQVANVQKRSAAEQVKLDMFQQEREFMDQLERDLHEAGYPNQRNYAPTAVTGQSDPRNAVGLVKVADNQLWFEGDVDGNGTVESVQYWYDTAGNNCPCLKRSQKDKDALAPLAQGATAVFQTEVQNVQNGTATDPIFAAFRADGTQVTLPVDIANNPADIAAIKLVRISLRVQARAFDLQTRQFPQIVMSNTVSMNNCSQAANCVGSGASRICGPGGGMIMSCE